MNNISILHEAIFGDKYYTNIDLRMNNKIGYNMSKRELDEYICFKSTFEDKIKNELPLKTFDSSKIYFYYANELMNYVSDYSFYLKEENDLIFNKTMKNKEEILYSMVFSEIEGTLKIEGVNTTRKEIQRIIKEENIKDKNARIIKNMYNGFNFIKEAPDFNKDNLKKLYNILTYESLAEADRLYDNYYRNDDVLIGNDRGCPVDKINECMDSLFEFVNNCGNDLFNLLPAICHYYIIYVHPYIDYNGRTARMVSIWITLLLSKMYPLYLSEAINDNKSNYYKSIAESRNSDNDLTYFITYIFKEANEYYLTYKNLNIINNNLENKGEELTFTEKHYLKRIIINRGKWFNYKGFIDFCNLDITKQGALKILNNFENLGLLSSKFNSKGSKIFKFNEDLIEFSFK